MAQTVFKSKYPILEAAMYQGSTWDLALAVYEAGAYPTLCSWNYHKDWVYMKRIVENFIKITKSNNLHLMVELEDISEPKDWLDIVIPNQIPTVEIVYGFRSSNQTDLDRRVNSIIRPMAEAGIKVFKRTNFPMPVDILKKHYLTGYCIKGKESAGVNGKWSVRDLVLLQKKINPEALIIPYGGVGNSKQVKDYIDIGAEIIAVGTALAYTKENSISDQSKNAIVNSTVRDFTSVQYQNSDTDEIICRNTIEFKPYNNPEYSNDENRWPSLVSGLRGSDHTGHIYAGYAIDDIKEILSVNDVIQNLCKDL